MANITLRNVKGSPLTFDEMDQNFQNLNAEVLKAAQFTNPNLVLTLGDNSNLEVDIRPIVTRDNLAFNNSTLANKQSSVIGKLLSSGDYGLGVPIQLASTNISNLPAVSARYYCDSTCVDLPVEGLAGYLKHEVESGTTNNAVQLFHIDSTNQMFYRAEVGGTFSEWESIGAGGAGIETIVTTSGGIDNVALKFSDGTLICHTRLILNSSTESWIYANEFAPGTIPTVSATVKSDAIYTTSGSGPSGDPAVDAKLFSLNDVTVRVNTATESSTSFNIKSDYGSFKATDKLHVMAIGRWE